MARKITARWRLEIHVDLGFQSFWHEVAYIFQYEGHDDTDMVSEMIVILERTADQNPDGSYRVTKQTEPEIVWEDTR